MVDNLDVKCPKCNKEMEKGYIGTPRYISWLKDKNELITTGKTLVHDVFWRWEKNKMEARKCEECKIVMFSYPEINRKVDF